MAELWYKLSEIPDLSLNKYSSLEGNGVDGILEKHIAFLRQLNRKGIVSKVSFHLFYLYLAPDSTSPDSPGHRMHIFLMVRGDSESMENIPALIAASPLADFYPLNSSSPISENFDFMPVFTTSAFLTKAETFLPSTNGDEGYYTIREWEMNEDGRLYNMCKMMEALNHTVLYRVDLYPIEKSSSLRESLRKPMGILRQRQDDWNRNSKKDYDAMDALKCYEDLIEKFDSSPHFISNIMVLANSIEDAVSVLDAAGAESLIKGKYNISTFHDDFTANCFLDNTFDQITNIREGKILRHGKTGLLVCREETKGLNLNYLPSLFSLEEIAPFFRLPALYDGETIQIAKETAPKAVANKQAIFLGKDSNGYDVYFPLKLLPKHAFISGVPGSGKTNTMHHLISELWKKHRIPFLVLEPAKQEYRALLNDPEMSDLYLFSPNADMSFPLHINPFEMPKGTIIAEHIRRLCSVFEGSFPLEPPMPFLLDTAIEAVYRENGWNPDHVYSGNEMDGNKRRRFPTMTMLYKRLEQELNSTQYSAEVRGNLESALKVRIGSLLRREMGDVFDVPNSTISPEEWLSIPAIIELESMGTGPANFLTLMLCTLIRESLKVNPKYDGDVRHVILIEEAHNLIGPESDEQTGIDADPKKAATAFVVKMLAEVRALKESIFIADQLPTVMAQEVLKNTGLKLGLRITSSDDRNQLGSTMAASSLQLEAMSTFEPGETLIFYEGLMRPFTMRIKEWFGDITDEIEKKKYTESQNDYDLRIALKGTPSYIKSVTSSIEIVCRKYNHLFADMRTEIEQCDAWLDQIIDLRDKIKKIDNQLLDIALHNVMDNSEQMITLNKNKAELNEWVEIANSDLTKLNFVIKVIENCSEWVYTLDRLKNGRWRRSNSPEVLLKKSLIIQLSICETALRLCNKLLSIQANTDLSIVQDEAFHLSNMQNAISSELEEYIKVHGKQVFYTNH